jgi:hypothetical protein
LLAFCDRATAVARINALSARITIYFTIRQDFHRQTAKKVLYSYSVANGSGV